MRKSIKKTLSLSLIAAMALSMTACSGSDSSTSAATTTAGSEPTTVAAGDSAQTEAPADTDTEPVSLTFSWWGGDERHEATEKAIDAFMEKYPHITVTPEYGAWTGWEEKQSLNIVGGNGADVMQINWNWIESYSKNGTNFVNLEEYADIIDLTQFPDSALDVCKADNKLMAVPIALTGRLFFWNKTTFDEIGVDIPTDIDSLLSAGAAFKAYGDDYYPLALYPYDHAIFIVYYLESVYGKPWVENNELQYTEAEIEEGMQFLLKLEEEHVIPSTATIAGDMADSMDKNAKWIDGKYAGMLEWDSAASKMRQAVEGSTNKPGQEFVLGEFIDFGEYDGGFTKVSMGFSITATSEHPKEAAMLINFLLNEEEGVEILSTTRGVPCSVKAVEYLTANNLGDALVTEANKAAIDYLKFPLDAKFEHNDLKADPDGAYWKIFGKLSAGELDAANAAKELSKAITECLEG